MVKKSTSKYTQTGLIGDVLYTCKWKGRAASGVMRCTPVTNTVYMEQTGASARITFSGSKNTIDLAVKMVRAIVSGVPKDERGQAPTVKKRGASVTITATNARNLARYMKKIRKWLKDAKQSIVHRETF